MGMRLPTCARLRGCTITPTMHYYTHYALKNRWLKYCVSLNSIGCLLLLEQETTVP